MSIGCPQHIVVTADARIALLKNMDVAIDITERDYKKFGSETKITPLGEAAIPQP